MTKHLSTLCVAALLAAAPAAHADDTKAGRGYDSFRDIFYASLGVQHVTTDLDGVGASVNLSGATGVRIPTVDWISAELDGSFTIIPGRNDNQGGILGKVDCVGGVPDVPPGCTIPGGGGGGGGGGGNDNPPDSNEDLQMFAFGIYAVLRSPGRFYATGRIGYRYLGTSIDTADRDLYDKRSGVAWGGGIGWRWGDSLSGVEATYTDFGGQVRGIGLSIVYGFGG